MTHTGEEISIDARAYPASTSRLLHTEAPGHGGKLSIDDQYSSITQTTSCAARYIEQKMYVYSTSRAKHDTK